MRGSIGRRKVLKLGGAIALVDCAHDAASDDAGGNAPTGASGSGVGSTSSTAATSAASGQSTSTGMDPADLPAWRVGQAVNAWREIAGSAMDLCVPTNEARTLSGVSAIVGPRARMDAWCGLSIDTRSSEVWSVANGGHGDYYGNEIVKLDLMADAPAWVEWFAGSSGNVVDDVTAPATASLARYVDGKPCSTHSYYGQQFIERHDRALRIGGSIAPYGSGYQDMEAFDVTKGKGNDGWDPLSTYPPVFDSPGWTVALGFPVCKDPRTEQIYVVSTPSLRRFTPGDVGPGGVWEVVGSLPDSLNSGGLGATAIDTKRNRLLWIHGYGPDHPMLCDLGTMVWTDGAHPPSEAQAALDMLPQSLGMVYVSELDAYLVRAHGAGPQVFAIDAETLAVSFLATTGGDSIPLGATLTNEEGVYNRWLLVPKLGGVVYFPSAGVNAWFLRLY